MRTSLYFAGSSLLIVGFFFVISGGLGSGNPALSFLGSLACNAIPSIFIGGLSWLVIPRIAYGVRNLPRLGQWTLLLAAMATTATIGSALAITVARNALDGSTNGSWNSQFRDGLQYAIPITLVVGSVFTSLGLASARVQTSELALRTLQLEQERAQKLVAETRLALLTARVQPHFLFNTLNAISALVYKDPEQANAMIERLSSLLRSSLDGGETTSIEQEWKLVSDYLEIQRVRLGDRIRYRLSKVEGLTAAVPPFSVQTLVENSVKHVAGKRPEGVSISVCAALSGSNLIVEVTDDGPGFREQSVSGGLDNLQSRLRAIYGNCAGLEFLPGEPGMTVRMRIPVS